MNLARDTIVKSIRHYFFNFTKKKLSGNQEYVQWVEIEIINIAHDYETAKNKNDSYSFDNRSYKWYRKSNCKIVRKKSDRPYTLW